ncbi:hypothetical protein A2154_02695 [Candidatus Gottesmanbacteria bacterium RBG_16_43_7]|uniref:Sortase n=1 Tax=Candidatus Gottesmanbacteria bacterium RBG_16_43_7 TaxID=1798373 RepID=A0A1F5Z9U4_9BACT|nr:MAG: hypothetical protein A2154_02695 [Candidatus Gottesmanbacteria bacterium RBG_16_43_7]
MLRVDTERRFSLRAEARSLATPNVSNPTPVVQLQPAPVKAPQTRNQSQTKANTSWSRRLGLILIALALGGIIGPFTPQARLETAFFGSRAKKAVIDAINPPAVLPPSAPLSFDPLVAPDGAKITPINTDFSLIIPKIGVNSEVVEGVNPADPTEYNDRLKTAVAHASTSYTPDEKGTVYLFSHSTNYQWFVRDLNAVFYMVKDLVPGDTIVIFYHGARYTYEVKEKRVVRPNQVSYLVPDDERKTLILQTCWPPGSIAERLLVFADLIEEQTESI